jgi:hypothetical protein
VGRAFGDPHDVCDLPQPRIGMLIDVDDHSTVA